MVTTRLLTDAVACSTVELDWTFSGGYLMLSFSDLVLPCTNSSVRSRYLVCWIKLHTQAVYVRLT